MKIVGVHISQTSHNASNNNITNNIKPIDTKITTINGMVSQNTYVQFQNLVVFCILQQRQTKNS